MRTNTCFLAFTYTRLYCSSLLVVYFLLFQFVTTDNVKDVFNDAEDNTKGE